MVARSFFPLYIIESSTTKDNPETILKQGFHTEDKYELGHRKSLRRRVFEEITEKLFEVNLTSEEKIMLLEDRTKSA